MSQEEADLREGSGEDACSNVSARTAGLTGFRVGIKVGIRDAGKMKKGSGFQARLRCVCLLVCSGGGRAPGFKRPPIAFPKRPGFTSALHPEMFARGVRMQRACSAGPGAAGPVAAGRDWADRTLSCGKMH